MFRPTARIPTRRLVRTNLVKNHRVPNCPWPQCRGFNSAREPATVNVSCNLWFLLSKLRIYSSSPNYSHFIEMLQNCALRRSAPYGSMCSITSGKSSRQGGKSKTERTLPEGVTDRFALTKTVGATMSVMGLTVFPSVLVESERNKYRND